MTKYFSHPLSTKQAPPLDGFNGAPGPLLPRPNATVDSPTRASQSTHPSITRGREEESGWDASSLHPARVSLHTRQDPRSIQQRSVRKIDGAAIDEEPAYASEQLSAGPGQREHGVGEPGRDEGPDADEAGTPPVDVFGVGRRLVAVAAARGRSLLLRVEDARGHRGRLHVLAAAEVAGLGEVGLLERRLIAQMELPLLLLPRCRVAPALVGWAVAALVRRQDRVAAVVLVDNGGALDSERGRGCHGRFLGGVVWEEKKR